MQMIKNQYDIAYNILNNNRSNVFKTDRTLDLALNSHLRHWPRYMAEKASGKKNNTYLGQVIRLHKKYKCKKVSLRDNISLFTAIRN